MKSQSPKIGKERHPRAARAQLRAARSKRIALTSALWSQVAATLAFATAALRDQAQHFDLGVAGLIGIVPR